jgi:hypothetical protein
VPPPSGDPFKGAINQAFGPLPQREYLMTEKRGRKEERQRRTFEGSEYNNADLGICMHGFLDDQDCIECRTVGCSGGSDCDCLHRRTRQTAEDSAY